MMTDTGPSPRIGIAILAAGLGQRFGGQKLTSEWRGQPIVSFVLKAAHSVFAGNIHLVTGHDAEAVTTAAGDLVDATHFNPRYGDGIGTSIATATRALRDQYDAIVIALADQPLVTADHLQNLVTAGTDIRSRIVATRSNDVLCPPARFGERFFDKLCGLSADRGAKSVIDAHPEAVDTILFEAACVDIDTPEDLATLEMR